MIDFDSDAMCWMLIVLAMFINGVTFGSLLALCYVQRNWK